MLRTLIKISCVFTAACPGLSRADAAHRAPSCDLFLRSGISVCYPPDRVTDALDAAGISAIDPSDIVASIVGLHLRQAIVNRVTGEESNTQIHFLFGHFPRGYIEIPVSSGVTPRYAVVEEVTGRWAPVQPTITHVGRNMWPWTFTGFAPQRSLSIFVTSNADRAHTLRMGVRILAVLEGGK